MMVCIFIWDFNFFYSLFSVTIYSWCFWRCVGFITADELTFTIRRLDGNPRKEEIQDMISEVDIDGKGFIDFEEFLNIMSTKIKVRYYCVHQIYD